jgi:hypothetical protein
VKRRPSIARTLTASGKTNETEKGNHPLRQVNQMAASRRRIGLRHIVLDIVTRTV